MVRPGHARREVSEDQIVPTVNPPPVDTPQPDLRALAFFQRNEIPKLHSHPFLISVFESLLLAGAKLRAGVCVR